MKTTIMSKIYLVIVLSFVGLNLWHYKLIQLLKGDINE
jgi:hypothetical protein